MSASSLDDGSAVMKRLLDSSPAPGDEVILPENQQPVAKLVSEQPKAAKPSRPGPGLCKGMITYIAPDFDAPLEDMKDYMQ
jgi:hypothetical protein